MPIEFIDEQRAGQLHFLLGRHGKAVHNLGDKFAGCSVDSKLSKVGQIESLALAKELFRRGGCDIIAYSAMRRSFETAEIIKAELERLGSPPVRLIKFEQAEEVDVGDFTGHTSSESYKIGRKAAEHFYKGNIKHWNFPGGENYGSTSKRVAKVMEQASRAASPGQRILFVGHGMFNRVILHDLFPDKKEYWELVAYPHDRIFVFSLPGKIEGEIIQKSEE